MQIISHRGYWKRNAEMNTEVSFERSFSLGYGVETDIRDFKGKLVISHDIPTKKSLPLTSFFKIYKKYNFKGLLALNIKADGIQEGLKKLLKKYNILNYFVFDMSIPEQLKYNKQGFRTLTRQSEYEKKPIFYKESKGVWRDCFTEDWVSENIISEHLKNKKLVCLVSPELHKRDPILFWKKLSSMKIIRNKSIILCTDIPEEAERFFHGKN